MRGGLGIGGPRRGGFCAVGAVVGLDWQIDAVNDSVMMPLNERVE